MSRITTHVLDAVKGKPAEGVAVRLEKHENALWTLVNESATDADGRCRNLSGNAAAGLYRLSFSTEAYFARNGRTSLYTQLCVAFNCSGDEDYHLPLLLSDNSYTTYRGS